MGVVCIYLIRQVSIIAHPTVSIGNYIFLAAYVIGVGILVLGVLAACCCNSSADQNRWECVAKRYMKIKSPPVLYVSRRQLLQRFWAVLRLCSIVFGLFALLLFATPDFNGGILDSTYGDNKRSIRSGSYFVVGLSYLTLGLVMRQSLRAAVVRFVGRRTKFGGSKEVEAASDTSNVKTLGYLHCTCTIV